MEKIGLLLKQRREELGLTIEEVSNRTRLTIKHIKAIENGDISYFKDDLSYLRFFLRSYCETIDLDFCELKDLLNESINDYTASFSVATIKRHEAIERNIRNRSDTITEEKKRKVQKKDRRFSVDISLLSFIGIGIVILIGVVFAAIFILKDGILSSKDKNIANIPNTLPEEVIPSEEQSQPNQEAIQPPQEEKEEVHEFAITKVSEREYQLHNIKENDEVNFEVIFGSSSAFRVLVDGVELSNPAYKIYPYNSTLEIKQIAKKGTRISLAFGFMQNNRIKVNGVEVEIDKAYKTLPGSVVLEFVVEGD